MKPGEIKMRYKRHMKRNMIKYTIASIVLLLVFTVCPAENCHAGEVENIGDGLLKKQIDSNEVKKIQNELGRYSNDESRRVLGNYNPKKIIEDAARGVLKFNLADVFKNAVKYMLNEIYQNLHILIQLVMLVILCSVLKNLQASFLSSSVGELAFYACYIAIVSVAVISFDSAIRLGLSAIDQMVNFMYATLPLLITLLVSSGNFTSGSVFQPVLVMIIDVSAMIMKNAFIPMIFFSTVLSIINNISGKIQLSRLAGFFKQIAGWGIGILLTVFVAVLTTQGSLGAVVDGVAGKITKYAIGTFVPVTGKYLADAADAVLGYTLLVRNATGLAVMIGIISICIIPLLKMVAVIAIYRITCALVEPISEKRVTDCISDIAGSMTYILGIASTIAFMFLISVTVIISAGNLSTMIR